MHSKARRGERHPVDVQESSRREQRKQGRDCDTRAMRRLHEDDRGVWFLCRHMARWLLGSSVTRAPKGCPKTGCVNRQPCPTHKSKSGWVARPSKWEPPRNWKALRSLCIKLARGLCAHCGGPGTDVDHIISRADGGLDIIANLQFLCNDCHKKKTAKDNQARRKK